VVALQLVPLPLAVVRLLSPEAAALLARHLGGAGVLAGAHPLSLDPGATARELAKLAMWTAIAAAVAIKAEDRRRRDVLLGALALSGPVVVAVVYGAALLAARPLLEPHVPFVNPNHLAGFLLLAAWPALGLALRARGPARVGWLVAFAFTASGVFLSLSRGGIGAFVVGAGVFGILQLRDGRGPESKGAARSVFIGAVSAALGLAAFLAFDRIVSELGTVSEASTTEVKLALWPSALQVIRDHPLVGIGRGAFANVFPAYKWDPVLATFTHVENEWLQLPVDLGLLVGPLVIGLFAWAWVAAARRRALSRPMMGALAGAAALVAQNALDFSLELSGVAIPFAIVMAIAARDMPAVRVPRWAVRGLAAAALLLSATGVTLAALHRPADDADRVVAAATPDDAVAAARAVLPWHPADWVIPAAVGTKLAAVFRCDEAEPWLARATERNPTAAAPQRGAAQCYVFRGNAPLARRAYRLAFILGDREALREARLYFPGKGELFEIAPDTPGGLLAAAALLRDDWEEAREAYRRAWESFRAPAALGGLAAVALDLGEPAEALARARELQAVAPLDPGAFVLAARALTAQRDDDAAIAELQAGAGRFPGRPEVLEPLGQHQLAKRRFSQARTTFEQIVARDPAVTARKKLLVAQALEGQQRYGEALRMIADARDAAPDSTRPLEALARVSAKAGRYEDAIQALELAAKKPNVAPGAYAAWLDQLRMARVRQAVTPAEPAR
jgi:tetratricopeptide (TPR) repeat protein